MRACQAKPPTGLKGEGANPFLPTRLPKRRQSAHKAKACAMERSVWRLPVCPLRPRLAEDVVSVSLTKLPTSVRMTSPTARRARRLRRPGHTHPRRRDQPPHKLRTAYIAPRNSARVTPPPAARAHVSSTTAAFASSTQPTAAPHARDTRSTYDPAELPERAPCAEDTRGGEARTSRAPLAVAAHMTPSVRNLRRRAKNARWRRMAPMTRSAAGRRGAPGPRRHHTRRAQKTRSGGRRRIRGRRVASSDAGPRAPVATRRSSRAGSADTAHIHVHNAQLRRARNATPTRQRAHPPSAPNAAVNENASPPQYPPKRKEVHADLLGFDAWESVSKRDAGGWQDGATQPEKWWASPQKKKNSPRHDNHRRKNTHPDSGQLRTHGVVGVSKRGAGGSQDIATQPETRRASPQKTALKKPAGTPPPKKKRGTNEKEEKSAVGRRRDLGCILETTVGGEASDSEAEGNQRHVHLVDKYMYNEQPFFTLYSRACSGSARDTRAEGVERRRQRGRGDVRGGHTQDTSTSRASPASTSAGRSPSSTSTTSGTSTSAARYRPPTRRSPRRAARDTRSVDDIAEQPGRPPSPAAHTFVSSTTRRAEDRHARAWMQHTAQSATGMPRERRAKEMSAGVYGATPASHETTRAPATQRDAGRRGHDPRAARKERQKGGCDAQNDAGPQRRSPRRHDPHVSRIRSHSRVAQNDAGSQQMGRAEDVHRKGATPTTGQRAGFQSRLPDPLAHVLHNRPHPR
ncbi:hypothetical protein C8J57DRAFT_1231034 [Mycena rebaudengoi]|nr:hypothetical protein C8J57DRAFT_1231034 [Mycena rebaudengoi]